MRFLEGSHKNLQNKIQTNLYNQPLDLEKKDRDSHHIRWRHKLPT